MRNADGEHRVQRQGAADQLDDRLLSTLERLLTIDAVEVHEALDQATQLVAEALGADKVDAFLLEAASNTLVARGTSDTPMGRKQKAEGMDKLPVVNGGRTIQVYQTGAPYMTGHADQDPGELVGITQGLGVRSTMAVALPLRGEGRGVLVVASATPERFTERDMRFLEAISSWIGLVAYRAESVERVAREALDEGRRRAAEELITVVAHDLRNYLTPLQARLDLIQRRAERQQHTQYVQDARFATREVHRLTRMIVSLLDVSRIEQGMFALRREPTDVVALVQETAEALSTSHHAIEVDAPEEVIALVDPDRLRQALENLLSNALRFSPDHAPVRVEVTTQPASPEAPGGATAAGHVMIAVSDQGPGIAPELLPHLFERFMSGANSVGIGIGLYLASQIALAHNGRLTAESPPGQGARFQLALPIVPGEASAVSAGND